MRALPVRGRVADAISLHHVLGHLSNSKPRRDVEGEKHREPDDVDEVPVHATNAYGGVTFGIEVVEQRPDENEAEHDLAHDNVRHMEARDGEIERAIGAR